MTDAEAAELFSPACIAQAAARLGWWTWICEAGDPQALEMLGRVAASLFPRTPEGAGYTYLNGAGDGAAFFAAPPDAFRPEIASAMTRALGKFGAAPAPGFFSGLHLKGRNVFPLVTSPAPESRARVLALAERFLAVSAVDGGDGFAPFDPARN